MTLTALDRPQTTGSSATPGTEGCLRVALDLGMVGQNRTGTGTYVRALSNELARLADLELRLLRGWPTVPNRAGLPGRAVRAIMDAAWVQLGVPLALRSAGVDLLHSPIYLAPLQAPCPLIVTVHDTIHRRFPEDYRRWWL